jgi:hypothetical protein
LRYSGIYLVATSCGSVPSLNDNVMPSRLAIGMAVIDMSAGSTFSMKGCGGSGFLDSGIS